MNKGLIIVDNTQNSNFGTVDSGGGPIRFGNDHYDGSLIKLEKEVSELKNQYEQVKGYLKKYPDDNSIKNDLLEVSDRYIVKVNELEDYKNRALDAIRVADHLKNESNSPKIFEAAKLLQLGNFKGVSELLINADNEKNSNRLLDRRKIISELQTENNRDIINNSNENLLAAQVSIVTEPENSQKIIGLFKLSIKVFASFYNYRQYLNYLIKQNHPDARNVFSECFLVVSIHEKGFQIQNFLKLKYDYALLLSNYNQYQQSLEISESLIVEYYNLHNSDSINILSDYSDTLILIAKNFKYLANPEAALPILKRARRVKKNLLKGGNINSIAGFNSLNNNLTVIYSNTESYDKSIKVYLQNIEVVDNVLKDVKYSDNENILESKLLTIAGLRSTYYESHYNQLCKNGFVKIDSDAINFAEVYGLESLNLSLKLQKLNFYRFSGLVENSSFMLQRIYRMRGKIEECQTEMDRSVSIMKGLFRYNPEKYHTDLIRTYYQVMCFWMLDNQERKAINLAKEMIEYLQLNSEEHSQINPYITEAFYIVETGSLTAYTKASLSVFA